MLTFRRFLQESYENPRLSPNTIYNFGYLAYLVLYGSSGLKSREQFINDELKILRNKYLEDISDLCLRQIKKYLEWGRLDKKENGELVVPFDFDKVSKMNTSSTDRMITIDRIMQTSCRYDMKTRNKAWNLITKHLVELANAKSNKDLVAAMDRLNNDVHNRGAILEKFPNGDALMTAFDKIHNAKTPQEFKARVSSSITELENI